MRKPVRKWEIRLPTLQVLVVEDDMMIRILIQQTLKDMGLVHIDLAKDGADAWEKFDTDQRYYDLIVCDWMMPVMSGIDFLKKVRKKEPGIAFMMLTAKNTMGDVVEARELGVNAYVAKPFTGEELKQKVLWLARQVLDPDFNPTDAILEKPDQP